MCEAPLVGYAKKCQSIKSAYNISLTRQMKNCRAICQSGGRVGWEVTFSSHSKEWNEKKDVIIHLHTSRPVSMSESRNKVE